MLLTQLQLPARLNRLFQIAYGVALAGPGTCGRNKDSYRLGAIIYDSKTILAAGCNSYITHPYLARYTEYPFKHAEAAALLALGKYHSQDKKMIVVRVRRDGHIANASPCKELCLPMIEDFGIREVQYTMDTGIGQIICR